MRMLILSALFAVGVGFAGTTGASAAVVGNGINSNAVNSTSLIEDIQWRRGRSCRSVRVCHRGRYGNRRCHIERICRR